MKLEETQMRNFFTTLTVAIALVFTVQISAQDMEDTITLTTCLAISCQ